MGRVEVNEELVKTYLVNYTHTHTPLGDACLVRAAEKKTMTEIFYKREIFCLLLRPCPGVTVMADWALKTS